MELVSSMVLETVISMVIVKIFRTLYYNNDKLLIPIENLELITRYGSIEKNITLDKLGL